MNLYVGEVNFVPAKDGEAGSGRILPGGLHGEDFRGGRAAVRHEHRFPEYLGAATFTAPNTKKIWTAGLNAAFNVGPVTLSGFGLYQFGKVEFIAPAPGPSDIDVNGYAADLRVDAKLGPGKFFIEGLYISGGDNTADEYESIVTLSDVNASPGGNSAYSRTDMMILLANGDAINTAQSFIGSSGVAQSAAGPGNTSPGNGGRGMWHIGAGFSMPLGKQLTGKVGAGYLEASELLKTDQGGDTGSGRRARGWAPRSTRT